MKGVISQYGRLTQKQIEAVQRCLNTPNKQIDMTNVPEDIKKILDYKGQNSFVMEIAAKFMTYGTMTDRQKSSALQAIEKEVNKTKKVNVRVPVVGNTIKIGRAIGSKLKNNYHLKFNPILLDVTKIIGVTQKAVKLSAKMTIKRGDVCMICAKTLTDEFSMLTHMGKQCAKNVGVEYITDRSQAEIFRNEYLKKVEEIGEFEFWVPTSQIKYWDGQGQIVYQSIQETL